MKVDCNKCCYCGGCVGVCPQKAIVLKETKIEIDKKLCINCKFCKQLCPVGAIEDEE